MRESFVIHAEYIEDLPIEYKSRFLQYVYEYGIHDIEPKLSDLELTIWTKIKRRLDVDKNSYKTKVEYHEAYNYYYQCKREGVIDKSVTFAEFKKSENFKNFKKFKSFSNLIDIDIVNDIDTDIVNDTVNDIDIDTDIVNDIEIENDIDIDADKSAPSSLSPSQTELSKTIMNLFKSAKLPCCRGNEISFLQRDFMNALTFLHKTPQYKSLHSDEIIQAIGNYIEVINDPDCYYKKKMDFYSLVQSKLFWNFLPGNYDIESFKNYSARAPKAPEEFHAEVDYSHAGESIKISEGGLD